MSVESGFHALTYVWLALEIYVLVFTTTWRGKGRIQDRGSHVILWIVIIGSLNIDERLHRVFAPDMHGSHSWLRPTALAIFVLGLGIRSAAIITLGRAFSANVAVRAEQKLERRGLYSLVRHPSYLGLEMILLALALHARTWACLAVVLIPPTLALLYRIHVEEIALRAAFGAEYEEYCRTTKRLIPGIY